MLIRAQAIAAVFVLVGLGLGVACSSSPASDAAPSSGAGGDSSGDSGSGATNRAGASGRGGGNARAGAAGKTGGEAGLEGKSGASTGGGSGGEDTSDGGEGGSVDPCAACPSGFCLPSGECVDCLPSNDHCPSGQYCTDLDVCASGCKNGASCQSGVCDAQHDCQSCLSDDECSSPRVCGNNACAPACTAQQEGSSAGCGAGLTCCSQHCVDARTDSKHCGACGTVCGAGQFCGVGGCLDSALANVCSIAKAVVVLDGGADGPHNEPYGRAIANALKAQCSTAPTVREVQQTVSDVINITTFRPVAGGDELLIAAGGGFFQHLVEYVSTQPITPVYFKAQGDTLQYIERKTNHVVASADISASHDAHDFFVIQFARDASSGSLVLNAQGFWESGTAAAAFYFEQGLLPMIASRSEAWYAYEWTDADSDLAPDLNEIKLIDSGAL